jgi:hypothetical protein
MAISSLSIAGQGLVKKSYRYLYAWFEEYFYVHSFFEKDSYDL